jgi:hypothetical protein
MFSIHPSFYGKIYDSFDASNINEEPRARQISIFIEFGDLQGPRWRLTAALIFGINKGTNFPI